VTRNFRTLAVLCCLTVSLPGLPPTAARKVEPQLDVLVLRDRLAQRHQPVNVDWIPITESSLTVANLPARYACQLAWRCYGVTGVTDWLVTLSKLFGIALPQPSAPD
jgi:hypothetical protein